MSKEKIAFILEKIKDALDYKEEFGSIENLLNSKLGFDAVTMCLLQIGETLNKLDESFQSKYSHLPYKESYLTRNYIAHDYEGIDKMIIEVILREHLPQLKKDLEKILKEMDDEASHSLRYP